MSFFKNIFKKVPKKPQKFKLTSTKPRKPKPSSSKPTKFLGKLPTRKENIEKLGKEEYDVVIIGGGITGAGCALDAVTRGLKTALIEHDDFGSGTSSRSTKLVHGGVRYLQEAIMKRDTEQIKILFEALYERGHMLQIAPHLTRPLQFVMPIYKWYMIPYVWSGLKMYDILSGFRTTLRNSSLHTKRTILEMFPTINPKGLCGGVVYYDGQMDDARFALTVALTAARSGATILNHASVTAISKEKGCDKCSPTKITGVCVTDQLTEKKIGVHTKCVINATGLFADDVRKLDDKCAKPMCTPSIGVHVVLPGCYVPSNVGLINPSSDGRVVFMLPWQGHSLVGTTDKLTETTFSPRPEDEQVQFILNEVNKSINPDIKVTMDDVLSCWAGIRPLVTDPSKKDTKSLARNHVVVVSNTGLVTITGGKFTTYRAMAREAVNAAVKQCKLKPKYAKCQTNKLKLLGAHKWSPTMYFKLMKEYDMSCSVAKHLSKAYGDQAFKVANLALKSRKASSTCTYKKLHPKFPYLEDEVRYQVRKEHAIDAVDVIARRFRLAFLNFDAAVKVIPRVVDIMSKERKWTDDQKECQHDKAMEFLCMQMRAYKAAQKAKKKKK